MGISERVANICTYLDQNGEQTGGGEKIVRGVFRLLEKKVTEGELENLRDLLPPDLLDLWPPAHRAA